MNEETANEEVIKEENVLHLKSKINALQGTLYLTPKRLVLESHKTTVGGGVLGILLKSRVEKKNHGFEFELSDITQLMQGKHGLQKNVLEVSSNKGEKFRVVVKNYQEWEEAINKLKN